MKLAEYYKGWFTNDEKMAFNYHGPQGYNFNVPFNLAMQKKHLKIATANLHKHQPCLIYIQQCIIGES